MTAPGSVVKAIADGDPFCWLPGVTVEQMAICYGIAHHFIDPYSFYWETPNV